MKLSVIVLAAGKSKRMHTSLPKILHPLAGIPLLQRVVDTAHSLDPAAIYIVYNNGKQVRESLPQLPVQWIEQSEQLGTGHAVLQAIPQVPDNHQILILFGDVPLISKTTLNHLLKATPENGLALITVERDDPSGYGRILRDSVGKIMAIVEDKDATPQQKKIKEVNTGILTSTAKNLKHWLPKLKSQNAQGEYYLTDIIALAVADNCIINSVKPHSSQEVQGINDRTELAKLERYCQHQIAKELMLRGVTLMDPLRFDVRGELMAETDVLIDVNVIIEGKVKIGTQSKIGPNTYLHNVEIGKNVEIRANCFIEDAKIADNCIIGPFARIRPETQLRKNVRIGNFVEIKKSTIDEGSKVPHLTYIGDATIGKDVNIGCGVITCNYDGVQKSSTIIKDGAFIGSDSQLIAPVTIGENAYIGSGSTITRNAPANRLTLARAKQATIENWQPPKKTEK